ncbi:MAG: alpha-L-rhamnosidase C-terminal domain-containing protein [Capsulimonadaceae bacterium]|nr:alpha-L-rhamnosidase C-terminal domain-containing protein [Capsulimonadaceae bacterium]
MRVLLDRSPFITPPTQETAGKGYWPAKWITHPAADGVAPIVMAFRLRVHIAEEHTVRLHVSADERYEIYLDGVRFGRGPERGDVDNWFFETYDVPLSPGAHTIVAHVWRLGKMAPSAQMSYLPGFVLAAENEPIETFNTGHAIWETVQLGGYEFTSPGVAWGSGANLLLRGAEFHWGFEKGAGDGWASAINIQEARNKQYFDYYGPAPGWRLRPALLPPMLEQTVHAGSVRHIEELDVTADGALNTANLIVSRTRHRKQDESQWNGLLAGSCNVTIPANTALRVIIDLENYYCAYPEFVLSGGRANTICAEWAESLYLLPGKRDKGNRNDLEGKYFAGVGDTFVHDGVPNRRYTTLWWQAGRYMQLTVATRDEPLTIERFALRETHYPLDATSRFNASDPRFATIGPIMLRALEMCSHETYMDCPYYEQLMYLGDTRIETLMAYAVSAGDRLPRKALALFNCSRDSSGLTASRYPSRTRQVIPPFSLWWVAMVHDFAFWRDDRGFVRSLMPGVRSVIDAYLGYLNEDGLIQAPDGWNCMDWVPSWVLGVPPNGAAGVSGVLNWHFIYVLGLAAELERLMCEPVLASRYECFANDLAERATDAFFDHKRGMLADDVAHETWSEHSQCLALLSGRLPFDRRSSVFDGLVTAQDIERTTIYFSHYLFETLRLMKRPDILFDRLQLWFDLPGQGFKTTFEEPEPSRSDCHAWGAHPLFHLYASILGIRPLEPSFKKVLVEPQLGPLKWAEGGINHRLGRVNVRFVQSAGELEGTVTLPPGLSGVLRLGATTRALEPGVNEF